MAASIAAIDGRQALGSNFQLLVFSVDVAQILDDEQLDPDLSLDRYRYLAFGKRQGLLFLWIRYAMCHLEQRMKVILISGRKHILYQQERRSTRPGALLSKPIVSASST